MATIRSKAPPSQTYAEKPMERPRNKGYPEEQHQTMTGI